MLWVWTSKWQDLTSARSGNVSRDCLKACCVGFLATSTINHRGAASLLSRAPFRSAYGNRSHQAPRCAIMSSASLRVNEGTVASDNPLAARGWLLLRSNSHCYMIDRSRPVKVSVQRCFLPPWLRRQVVAASVQITFRRFGARLEHIKIPELDKRLSAKPFTS